MLLNHSIIREKSSREKTLPQGFLWAGNGIFRSVERAEFKAIVPYASVETPGLPEINTKFQLLVPQVPQTKVQAIIEQINQYPNLEQLFYLYWRGTNWEVVKPEQECTANSCLCLETFPEPAVIEIHSHGCMGAFFSSTDDAEETGCRISTVIGRQNGQLEIISRVCVHGLFMIIDSHHLYATIEDYCRVKYS
jgi:PRTRC genetic system protein A